MIVHIFRADGNYLCEIELIYKFNLYFRFTFYGFVSIIPLSTIKIYLLVLYVYVYLNFPENLLY